jgi:hypothetical protein
MVDEVQRLLDEVAHLLGAPATLEGPDFELIAYGIATATGAVRTPAEPALGIRTRLCLPVRHGSRLLGYVWLLDEGHIDTTFTGAAAQVAGLVAGLAELLLEREAHDLGSALAAALTGAGPRRREAQQALATQLGASASVVVVGAGGVAGAGQARSTISAEIEGEQVQVLAEQAVPNGRVGVSEAFTDVADLRKRYSQARFAYRVASAMPLLGPVVRWSELGAYRLLREVPLDDAGVIALTDALATVPELRETAEVFLDEAGAVQRAAAQLHIHRQTLYYRLSRIEELTGLDLGSGSDRLLLHLAVRLARLRDVSPQR